MTKRKGFTLIELLVVIAVTAEQNLIFPDWFVRHVGLKELWTLKWHRTFNVSNVWTTAGNVNPAYWPQWMSRYKDY